MLYRICQTMSIMVLFMLSASIHARAPHLYRELYTPQPDYAYAVAGLCNVTQSTLDQFPINAIKRNRKKEETKIRKARLSVQSSDPYLIAPNTHRIWLTSEKNPQEVSLEHIGYYNASLQHYLNKPFSHHFWCNNKTWIPQTIAEIQNFNVPVIMHEISEVEDKFINGRHYRKFLKDEMFSFAADIARQEILVQMGGLYADIGIEQLADLEWTFKKYRFIGCLLRDQTDVHFIAAAKDTPLLKKSLGFLEPLMNLVKVTNTSVPLYAFHEYKERRMWQLIAAMEDMVFTQEAFFYEGRDYAYHGMSSWAKFVGKISLDYLVGKKNEIAKNPYNIQFLEVCLGKNH